MWKLNSDKKPLTPAYVYPELVLSSFKVDSQVPETSISQTSYQNNYFYRVSFIDVLKKLNSIKNNLDITFKPVKVSNSENTEAQITNIFSKNTFICDISSFFLTSELPSFNVFNTTDEDLYLTYEVKVSNINNIRDLFSFLHLPIEEIYIDIQTPQPVRSKITFEFLQQVSFNSSTSVTFVVKQLFYKANKQKCSVFCFETKADVFRLKSINNNLSTTPDIINWNYQGVFRLIELPSNIKTQSFYINRTHINFVTDKL